MTAHLWEVPLMDVLQMLHRVASPPCADCLYRLGVVRCVVCPSFCGSRLFGDRSRRRDDGAEKRGKRMK